MNSNDLKINSFTLSGTISKYGASSITSVNSNYVIGGSVVDTLNSAKFLPIILRQSESNPNTRNTYVMTSTSSSDPYYSVD